MTAGIHEQSASVLARMIASGALSAKDTVEHFANRIQSQSEYNCILETDVDAAIAQANAIDDAIANGEKPGPLAGVPVIVKDGICTAGIKTTAGSKILEQFVPNYDATCVRKLKAAGAIVLAKSHMDEFAMGGSNENPHFGPAKNPWNDKHVPGGSSGGSAASVAARMSPLALGSDTGGSIRQPASFCGITGIKPTYGRVSRFGLIAFASSLDQIGPMAASAEDAALMLNVIGGHDPQDSTSANQPTKDWLANLGDSLKGKTLGLCLKQLEGIDEEVRQTVLDASQVFESLGAVIKPIELPASNYAVPAYYVIACCEASSNLARFDGVRYTSRFSDDNLEAMYSTTRSQGFGPEVQRRIMLGTFALSSGYYDEYYLRASKVRRLIKDEYDAAFKEVDAVLGATAPTPAFEIGEKITDPLQMYLADVFTVSANLAGIPAISAPGGFTQSGLPIGFQLQGRNWDEHTLLNLVHQFQTTTDWHLRAPKK